MLPPEELITTSVNSPHVKGTTTEWYYGECVLLRRENEWLWRVLCATPVLMVAMFWLGFLVA
jgi:type IV secretory pathway component VirB8